ncbi:MAG: CMP/dCMP kinase [Thiomicrorhabdus sp.]|nr:MAG: CMP/dCMP kinase [Thiomicrorhabdus sp.]
MNNTTPVVTIDGPSGVGKGTLAQYLTKITQFNLLDSGAIYRALAFGAVKNKLALDDVPALVALAKSLPVEFINTTIVYEGEDVTSVVRTEEIAGVASTVAVIPEVRSALMLRQKIFATSPGLIADGRDMGTVVFPNADIKLYLTASAQIRAERRVNQLKKQGFDANIVQITRDIEERDDRDLNRKTAPLKPAEDAIIIDTSNLNIDEVCQKAGSLLSKKGLIA